MITNIINLFTEIEYQISKYELNFNLAKHYFNLKGYDVSELNSFKSLQRFTLENESELRELFPKLNEFEYTVFTNIINYDKGIISINISDISFIWLRVDDLINNLNKYYSDKKSVDLVRNIIETYKDIVERLEPLKLSHDRGLGLKTLQACFNLIIEMQLEEEIERINKSIISNRLIASFEKTEIPEEEVLNDYELPELQQKILFLDHLGVIDFIIEKYKIISNANMGEILSPITDIKADTIRVYLNRIKDKVIDKENPEVLALMVKLKLKKTS